MEMIKDESAEAFDLARVKNEIQNSIDNFCIQNNIDNFSEQPQSKWSACMMATGAELFPFGFFVIDKARNIYNYVLLDAVAGLYMYLCKLYNKTPSLYDYSLLINISYRTLEKWKDQNRAELGGEILHELALYYNDYDKYINTLYNTIDEKGAEILTALSASIFDKLHTDREQALTARLVGNQNAIGTITTVNKEYAWNIQQAQQMTQARALTLAELPKLEGL